MVHLVMGDKWLLTSVNPNNLFSVIHIILGIFLGLLMNLGLYIMTWVRLGT